MSTSNSQPVLAKTASYSVTAADGSALITNRGATGTITITLPTQASVGVGFWVEVFVVAGYNVTVDTATADTMVTTNDATADSISWGTSSEIIGSGARFVSDGTGWLCIQNSGGLTGGHSIATVTIVTN